MSKTVLMTSGDTRTARHLIDQLLAHSSHRLRVLVRRHDTAEQMRRAHLPLAYHPHAVFATEIMDERSLAVVFQGVDVVVHDRPSVQPHEAALAMLFIDAAKEARVQHFVLCSVLHPVRTKLVTHRISLQIEEYLVESRVNYTILQPAHFMQNVSLPHVCFTGNLRLGFSPAVDQGFIDLRDFTDVLRGIVLNPAPHALATYELVSQNMPYSAVADILADTMQRPVACEPIPSKTYIRMIKEGNSILSEHAEDAMERIMLYFDQWGLTGNSNILRWLLGRDPTTWQQYAADMIRQAQIGDISVNVPGRNC